MKSDVKTAWVTALRSGDYEQGKDYLAADDRFCCLGVLCDLAVREGVVAHAISRQREDSDILVFAGEVSTLPTPVRHWAGINNDFGDEVEIDGDRRNLAAHNDEGCTFDEIAGAIEAQL